MAAYRIFPTLTLLLWPFMLLSQTTGKVSGRIVDENSQPVVAAIVSIEGTSLGAAADVDGNYYIINVPEQVYTIRAHRVGYTAQIISKVKVIQGLTTRVEFLLRSSTFEMQEVIIQHERPAVQKDLTSKMQGFEAEDFDRMPIRGSLQNLLTTRAGITADIMTVPISSQPVFGQFATIPNDGLHFRGGRTNETLYLFDGITVNDGLWGGFDLDVFGEYSLSSLRTLTGTFGPQYGEAMSGVVEMQTTNIVAKKYTGLVAAYTDKYGASSGTQNTRSIEFQVEGPVVGIDNLSFFLTGRQYATDGYIYGYLYPDYVDSRGVDKSGAASKVPMAYRDEQLIFGKIIWQPSESMKLRVGAFDTKSLRGMYNHYFKYNPYGTPHIHLADQLGYAKFTHLLSSSTFYDVTISRYARGFKSHMYDRPQDYMVVPSTGTAEFSISGTDYAAFDSKFTRSEVTWSISSQVTKDHFITAGAGFNRLETTLRRYNPQGINSIEDYHFFPVKANGFVNDKMEFEEIGLVLNLGLRYDYIDPNREYVTDISHPDGGISKAPIRQYFSPRLGISYPITDAAALRFGYGHYNQYPDFFKVYQGTNRGYSLYPAPDVKEVIGAIAKGNIQEERTTNYEVGVQVRVTPSISADVTGFYRKISNLIGIVIVEGYLTSGSVVKLQRFPSFDNVSFATVKGIEISLAKRLENNFTGFFNYTYSQSLVSSSVLFSLPSDISRTYPADWDQTHTASFGVSLDLRDDWGVSLLGNISSGLPYTRMQFRPNSERAPYISSLDASVSKQFSYAGVKAKVFVQVLNLLNRQNVWWVYSDSGRPGIDTNPATSDDYTNNPAMWGPGRRLQAGVSFSYR